MKQRRLKLFCIFILLSTVLMVLTGCKSNQTEQPQNVLVQSDDEKFQISIPETIEIEFNTDENYTLDLFCKKDNMYLYANTIYKNREIDLLDYVQEDKEYLLSTKENARDSTDITSMDIKDYKTYTYCLTYTDSSFGKDFYTQIVWIETSQNIYILNLEVITENKKAYTQIFNDIANSFTEL